MWRWAFPPSPKLTKGDAWPTPGVEKGLQTWDLPKGMHSPLWVWRGAFQPNLKLTNGDVDMQPILGVDSKLTKGDA